MGPLAWIIVAAMLIVAATLVVRRWAPGRRDRDARGRCRAPVYRATARMERSGDPERAASSLPGSRREADGDPRAWPSAPAEAGVEDPAAAPGAAEAASADRRVDSPPQTLQAHAASIGERVLARQELIEALCDSPEDPGRITRAVVADPALAVQVLRAVNSSHYGLRERTGSIYRAVVYLGHLEVRNIVWKACFSDAAWTTPAGDEAAVLDGFWRHSFRTSRIAHAAAQAMGEARPDDAATAALLHDLGKFLAITSRCAGVIGFYAPLRYHGPEELRAERSLLATDHPAWGGWTARAWGLPEPTVAAILRHHEPAVARPDGLGTSEARLILAVFLADALEHLEAQSISRSAGSGGAAIGPPDTTDRHTPSVGPYRPMEAWWSAAGVEDPARLLAEIRDRAGALRAGVGTRSAAA